MRSLPQLLRAQPPPCCAGSVISAERTLPSDGSSPRTALGPTCVVESPCACAAASSAKDPRGPCAHSWAPSHPSHHFLVTAPPRNDHQDASEIANPSPCSVQPECCRLLWLQLLALQTRKCLHGESWGHHGPERSQSCCLWFTVVSYGRKPAPIRPGLLSISLPILHFSI